MNPRSRNLVRAGFTLIEMLTVLAISAVMLTIIVLPVVQSFNMTRAAEAFTDAQAQARQLTERIGQEIGNAVSVRNNSLFVASTLNGNPQNLPASSLVVTVPGKNNGPTVEVVLPWTKLDIVEAAQGTIDPTLAVGSYRDPVSGKIDPTLKAPKGQVHVPVTPGPTVIRYFVGLRNPFMPYNDPYTGILMPQAGGRDNLYVLYRAEFQSTVYNGTTFGGNPALFALDSNGQAIMDDPRFFVADRTNTGAITQDNHNELLYHWTGQKAPWETGTGMIDNATYFARTVVETQVSRYDMIQPQYNTFTHVVSYDGNLPRLTPLVQFRPTIISNDPAAGQEALRPGEETDNAAAIGPDVYKTQYGLWSNAVVRTYPEGYLSGNTALDKYLVGYLAPTGVGSSTPNGTPPGFSIFYYDPASGLGDTSGGVELFDNYTYDSDNMNGVPYSFTKAALAANGRSNWLTNANARPLFTPYHLIPNTGKLYASFDISEVGTTYPIPNDPNPSDPNLPTLIDTGAALSPLEDTGAGAVYSPLSVPLSGAVNSNYDINRCYNLVWNQNTNLQPNVQRFLDLRVLPNADGTFGPLYPGTISGGVNGFLMDNPDGSTLSRCRIVPGSETVYGPDQLPGPNYGNLIRYTRVTQNPGPDQYKINYVDLQEPSRPGTGTTSIVDATAYQSALGLTNAQVAGFNPDVYDPTNFCSAVIQARYKAGYIQFNSDPNNPLPNSTANSETPVPFKIDYRFQFTGTLPLTNIPAGAGQSDVFAVDYDSRQLMQVLLTVRNYAQTTLPNPQQVTLKSTATIRNVIR